MSRSACFQCLHRGIPGLFVVAAVAVIGCGGGAPSGTVNGTITYKGTPLNSGTIRFDGQDGHSASGSIESDGKYSVSKVPVGQVKIVIRIPTPIPEKLAGKVPGSDKDANAPKPVEIPKEYGDPAKTSLTYTVKPGTQDYPIELK